MEQLEQYLLGNWFLPKDLGSSSFNHQEGKNSSEPEPMIMLHSTTQFHLELSGIYSRASFS
jgi:hypothetical protein